MHKESIFKSAIRSLFVSAFAVFGLFLGFFLIAILVMGASESKKGIVESENKLVVLPDADGNVEALKSDGPVLLQIDIEGVIGADDLEREDIREQLRESRLNDLKGDRVKGVLLYVNTPGGSVFDADSIYRALLEYKNRYQVPVYAYVDGLCASGGMYVSSAADKVYASEASIIGSIGVIFPTVMNFSKVLENLNIEAKTITSGKDKDTLNPFRPWKENEGQDIKDISDYYYNTFVDIVVANRTRVDKKKLIEVYGAKIFPPHEALEIGYIDQTNASRSDTLKALAQAAGIDSEEEYQVVRLKEKNWIKKLLKGGNSLFNGKIKHEVKLGNELPESLQGKFLYLYQPE